MKILHYALGFPPHRTGGLTKYCLDLMKEQIKNGHEVGMLWPGRIKKYGYFTKIEKRNNEELEKIECMSYELINPLPVPLLDGISNIDAFIQAKDEMVFYNFLKENNIQVIHIHTLMGLPKEFIEMAQKLNIKLIYTTHDYFGICPKWGLIYNGSVCEDDQECKKCVECNKTALSLNKIKVLQSNVYKVIKYSKVISYLRAKHNKNLYEESKNEFDNRIIINQDLINQSIKYKELRQYYISMLQKMDKILFNSTNTEKIYKKYFSTNSNGKVLSITHESIKDNREIREYNGILNIGYLGPITEHKGFFNVKNICDELYKKFNGKFNLHIFSEYSGDEKYLVKHKPYKYNELNIVMHTIDLLIVPSLWNETFGFTVAEALSYGVPVLVSNKVGAKDLLEENKSGIIYKDNEELKNILLYMFKDGKSELKRMNAYICNDYILKDIEIHCKEIMKIYKS